MAQDNMSLGRFQLAGLPPAARGVPQIEVTFDIDADGILNVSAKDQATNKEQTIRITASTNLTDSEVDRLVREAEDNRSADEERANQIKVSNEADSMIYQVERTLADLGDKVSESDRDNITSQLEELRQALETDDVNRIKAQTETVQNTLYALSQQLYATQEGQQDAPQGKPQDGDDVVEGQYSEV